MNAGSAVQHLLNTTEQAAVLAAQVATVVLVVEALAAAAFRHGQQGPTTAGRLSALRFRLRPSSFPAYPLALDMLDTREAVLLPLQQPHRGR